MLVVRHFIPAVRMKYAMSLFCHLFNRIIPTRMERMTFGQTLQCKPAAFQYSVPGNCVNSILGACGIKPAALLCLKRRNILLIQTYRRYCELSDDSHFSLSKACTFFNKNFISLRISANPYGTSTLLATNTISRPSGIYGS